MSEVITLPGGPTKATPSAAAPVAVNGWAYMRHHGLPPVIVNRDACDAALTAWARAQLEQVDLVLNIVSCGQTEFTADEIAGAVRHFVAQALAVVTELDDRAHMAETNTEP